MELTLRDKWCIQRKSEAFKKLKPAFGKEVADAVTTGIQASEGNT